MSHASLMRPSTIRHTTIASTSSAVPPKLAIEFGVLRVDEVEHEVVCEQLLVGSGEGGVDEGSGPHHEVEIRLLDR
jgi:hypothetical protein